MLQISFIRITYFIKSQYCLKIPEFQKQFLRSIIDFLKIESPSLEKENIIKNIRKLFRLEKFLNKVLVEIRNHFKIKDIRNHFRLEKENKLIKDIKLRDIINHF